MILKYLPIIIISLLFTPITIFAVDLPSGFDEPCPVGQSIIQETCFAINSLHDEIHLLIDRITSLDTRISNNETFINTVQTLANNIQTTLNIEITKLDVLTDRFNILESQGDVSYQGFQTIDARFTSGGFFMNSGLEDMYVPSYINGNAVIAMEGNKVVQEFKTYEIKIHLNGNVEKVCVLTSLQPIECESQPFIISKFDRMTISYKNIGGSVDVSYKVDLDAYVKMTEFP